MPVRTAAMCGALVIDSMPPATTTLAEPALIKSWPSMMAFMPEPQTLLSVVQPVEGGSPAANAAWRAGAWPRFAGNTEPISTSPTSAGAMPDCCSAAPMAAAPSLGVGKPVNWPRKAPIGVRLAAAMMMSDMMGTPEKVLRLNLAGREAAWRVAARNGPRRPAASARMSALVSIPAKARNYAAYAALPQTRRVPRSARPGRMVRRRESSGERDHDRRKFIAHAPPCQVGHPGVAGCGIVRLRRRRQWRGTHPDGHTATPTHEAGHAAAADRCATVDYQHLRRACGRLHRRRRHDRDRRQRHHAQQSDRQRARAAGVHRRRFQHQQHQHR